MAPKFNSYEEAAAYQLAEWAEGRPWHNPWLPGSTQPNFEKHYGECCPDFSCCFPENIWAKDRRIAFLNADDDSRPNMLMGSIINLVGPDTVTFIEPENEEK